MARLEIEESCKGEITVQCGDRNEIVIEGQEIYIENGKKLISDYVNADILPHISQYAEDEINTFVSSVKETAAAAATSAGNAETAATTATTKSDEAKTYSLNAGTAAESAQTYSQNAATSATAAASSASSADTSANTAKSWANSSQIYSNAALGYVNTAKTKATAAETSATAAASSETNAGTYADEAKSWAIGDITERTEGSSKYWAEQAESSVTEANILKITVLSATSGTFILETNKIYSAAIDGDTVFSLPETSDTGVFNQIKVMLKVTGSPAVTWGTSCFFNKESPTLEEGYYDVYFDYDNNLGSWVAGVLAKGSVS